MIRATPSRNSGFSLAELLIAAVCGSIVLMAALQMLIDYGQQDRQLVDSTLRKEELTRALNFLEMETRMGNAISTSAAGMPSDSQVSACTTGSYTPVLGLTLRQFQNSALTTYYVIYAIRNLASASDTPWQGPYAIYRCGPSFNLDGSYGSYSSSPVIVVDGITASNSQTCASGYSKLPNSSTGGFVACVNAAGRGVQLHLTGSANGSPLATIEGYAAARSL